MDSNAGGRRNAATGGDLGAIGGGAQRLRDSPPKGARGVQTGQSRGGRAPGAVQARSAPLRPLVPSLSGAPAAGPRSRLHPPGVRRAWNRASPPRGPPRGLRVGPGPGFQGAVRPRGCPSPLAAATFCSQHGWAAGDSRPSYRRGFLHLPILKHLIFIFRFGFHQWSVYSTAKHPPTSPKRGTHWRDPASAFSLSSLVSCSTCADFPAFFLLCRCGFMPC